MNDTTKSLLEAEIEAREQSLASYQAQRTKLENNLRFVDGAIVTIKQELADFKADLEAAK